jgi:hypothetical protein
MNNLVMQKFVILFIDFTILMYLDFVEKSCYECSDVIEKDILKNTTIFTIGLSLLAFVAEDKVKTLMSNETINMVIGVVAIVKFLSLYRFISSMRSEPCNQCTLSWRRRFLFYYSRMIMLMYVLSLIYIAHLYYSS